jgi:pteridine reductase
VAPQRVALVTGSGKRRVGNVIARSLANAGFGVAIHYNRSEAEAAATVTELQARGTDAIYIGADLAIEHQVAGLVDRVLEHFGQIDVLVNSAAIWMSRPLEQVTAEDVRRHFDVNTLGTFLCSQHVGLQMVKQPEGGSIILFGDWAIQRPYRNYAAYFPSKGAIPAMARSLAVELGTRNRRVRVNCIQPGPVMLPSEMSDEERERVIQRTLVKREGGASDVADTVLFLVQNDFVTGTCVTVDGGRTIYAGDDE